MQIVEIVLSIALILVALEIVEIVLSIARTLAALEIAEIEAPFLAVILVR